jgi:ethanolamine ammonia-lyase small subunit
MATDNELKNIIREVLKSVDVQAGEPEKKSDKKPAQSQSDPLKKRVDAWIGRKTDYFVQRPEKPWSKTGDMKFYLGSTQARLNVGRAGCRYKTETLVNFLSDHARAKDAVHSEVPEDLIKKHGLLLLNSAAKDKSIFLRRPDLGRKLSDESVATVREKCIKKPQVQIIAGDGLSATAITVNLPRILDRIIAGLKEKKITAGTPCYVRNARVAVGDQIGRIVDAEMICTLVGERPGLKSAESMGAYLMFLKAPNTTDAQRSVVSNIHDGGLKPEEAVKKIVELCARILSARKSGVDLI